MIAAQAEIPGTHIKFTFLARSRSHHKAYDEADELLKLRYPREYEAAKKVNIETWKVER